MANIYFGTGRPTEVVHSLSSTRFNGVGLFSSGEPRIRSILVFLGIRQELNEGVSVFVR